MYEKPWIYRIIMVSVCDDGGNIFKILEANCQEKEDCYKQRKNNPQKNINLAIIIEILSITDAQKKIKYRALPKKLH